MRTHAGIPVSQGNALRMMAVWSCVSLIADGVASLPVDTYREVKRKRVPVDTPAWLTSPNPYMTSFDFWHRVMVSLLLDGNAFIAVYRNGGGEVSALMPIDPGRVSIHAEEETGEVYYRLDGERYTRSQILHVPAFTRPGELRGLSPIEYARQVIGLGLAAEEYGARFFSQGTTMSGVIQHPGNPSREQVVMIRDMFKKAHSGIKNSHAVGILTGGATWQSITITPEQAQFLETRKFQKVEIANLYRVPAYMIDPTVTSTWGTGIEEQNKWFVDQTLMPWIVRLEEAFSTHLLPGNVRMRFNVNARLRAKTKERYESYAIALEKGFMTVDEVRALEDMEPMSAPVAV
ncbi:phage portal protein [Carbonactinospora thermoautotrophica]|uniref:phage portal protein n=2 Tax=Carbonactinospora thermoautotrophica TaxID=1469144 RepID=UPI00226D8399|nr:phage portal protein [Carbonactinospora thermoautotrophica]